MAVTFESQFISVPITTVQQTAPPTGLGYVCVLTPAGSAAISGGYTVYTSPEAIATALASNELTAQGAEDLTAVLAQDGGPSRVYVATYDDSTEDPGDAAAIIDAAPVDVGILVCGGRAAADIAALGTWLSASNARLWSYATIAQSAEADILTGTFPSSLASAQISTLRLIYATDGEPAAAAYAGALAGIDLTQQAAGSVVTLKSVAAEDITDAQYTFALANDASVPILQNYNGTTVLLAGHVAADGTEWSLVVTIAYIRRRLLVSASNLVSSLAATRTKLPYSAAGEALLQGVLAAEIGPLAPIHLTPGQIGAGPSAQYLPDGYLITTSRGSDVINASATVLIAGEPDGISFPITAIEAV